MYSYIWYILCCNGPFAPIYWDLWVMRIPRDVYSEATCFISAANRTNNTLKGFIVNELCEWYKTKPVFWTGIVLLFSWTSLSIKALGKLIQLCRMKFVVALWRWWEITAIAELSIYVFDKNAICNWNRRGELLRFELGFPSQIDATCRRCRNCWTISLLRY
jgi:hypothetical protein